MNHTWTTDTLYGCGMHALFQLIKLDLRIVLMKQVYLSKLCTDTGDKRQGRYGEFVDECGSVKLKTWSTFQPPEHIWKCHPPYQNYGCWRMDDENAMWITRNAKYIETDDTSEESNKILPWQVHCIPQSGWIGCWSIFVKKQSRRACSWHKKCYFCTVYSDLFLVWLSHNWDRWFGSCISNALTTPIR